MGRTILISCLSLVAGAGIAYLFLLDTQTRYVEANQLALDAPRSGAAKPTASFEGLIGRELGVGERAALYQIVVGADLERLRSMALEVGRLDNWVEQDFVLDLVLARMTEIDPNAGIDLVQSRNLGPEQSLAVALAVIAAKGIDERNMESLLAALPELDERRFRGAVLDRLAAADPRKALDIALATRDPAMRNKALARVASAWVARDPSAALAEIDKLANPGDRTALQSAVLAALSQRDPAAALDYIAQSGIPAMQQMGFAQMAIRQLAAVDPARALGLADRLGGQTGEMARMLSLTMFGQQDPLGALAFLDTLAPGRDRQTLLQAIGNGYGRKDPDAALAWLDSLESAPRQLYAAVLGGIAQTDAERALDLVFDDDRFADPLGAFGPSLMSVAGAAARSGDLKFADLAERVLAADGRATRENAMGMLASLWAQNDAEEALGWLVANLDRVGRNAIDQAAMRLARLDPQAAARFANRIPTEVRESFLRSVTLGYAQTDPMAAQAWISQFRGEPGYEAGVVAVVPFSAAADPRAAAGLLQTLGEDSPERLQAAGTIGRVWAARDPLAAQSWAFSLPSGSVRDAGLSGMIGASAEAPDPALLALYSSDQARQQGMLAFIYQVAQRDVAEARALLERHIDDPGLRRQGEQALQNFGGRGQVNIAPGFSRGFIAQ